MTTVNKEEHLTSLLSQCCEFVNTIRTSINTITDEQWPEIFEKLGVIKHYLNSHDRDSQLLHDITVITTKLQESYKIYLKNQRQRVIISVLSLIKDNLMQQHSDSDTSSETNYSNEL